MVYDGVSTGPYFVHVHEKGRKSNLTKAEQNTLRQIAYKIRNLGCP